MLVAPNIVPPTNTIEKDKSIGDDKKPKQKKETDTTTTTIVRETQITIREEIKIKGNKIGTVPISSVFDFQNPQNIMKKLSPAETMVEAKANVDSILASETNNKSKLIKKVNNFDKNLDQMDIKQLVEISEYIGSLPKGKNSEILTTLSEDISERIKDKMLNFDTNSIPNISIPPIYLPEIPNIKIEAPKEEKNQIGTNKDLKPLSDEELEWGLKMQEEIKKGYKPNKEEAEKYEDIYNRSLIA